MQTTKATHQVKHLSDYCPPEFIIEKIDLDIAIYEERTIVQSHLEISRQSPEQAVPLRLDGENLNLVSIRLDDKLLTVNDYKLTETGLQINKVPDKFQLHITNEIYPHENTQLMGLYASQDLMCTQCEPEGFRRITYYLDRPDVLTLYTTTIHADKTRYPVLLANGNLIAEGEEDDNRHWARWHDPVKKPSYLFAMVAGDLDCIEDEFITLSNRKVNLRIYAPHNDLAKCKFAMQALKQSMAWDEQAYGREYDLDIFMIVAVADFNMGAMENKGLNIFNSKYLYTDPQFATDKEHVSIARIIGHEYFHNWSGNRVTCRDWFQLSLKEGFTIFRDASFGESIYQPTLSRIDDVRYLRDQQFPEDAGPMAHPVLPKSFIEINNFYTRTIYFKGAELIRMLKAIVGAEGFRKGTDLYFASHDGQAVTIEEFIVAMETANVVDLSQFRHWYDQKGTPVLQITQDYNAKSKTLALHMKQILMPRGDGSETQALHIPLAMGILDEQGKEIALQIEDYSQFNGQHHVILPVKQFEQTFIFKNVPEKHVVSLLRGFSAPIKLDFNYSEAELLFLFANDPDHFNRWQAMQMLMTNLCVQLVHDYQQGKKLAISDNIIQTCKQVFHDKSLAPGLIAEYFDLPSIRELSHHFEIIDPQALTLIHNYILRTIAAAMKEELSAYYKQESNEQKYEFSEQAAGIRALKNMALHYLLMLENQDILELAAKQVETANNMTDQYAALEGLINIECPQRQKALNHFYQQWQDEPIVLDKWFLVQSQSQLPNVLDDIKHLMKHPAFNIKNPNKVKALIVNFATQNLLRFHDPSGAGYAFVADQVIVLDEINSQVAAKLADTLIHGKHFDAQRQQLMREQLERIAQQSTLSSDVYEIVSKALAQK